MTIAPSESACYAERPYFTTRGGEGGGGYIIYGEFALRKSLNRRSGSALISIVISGRLHKHLLRCRIPTLQTPRRHFQHVIRHAGIGTVRRSRMLSKGSSIKINPNGKVKVAILLSSPKPMKIWHAVNPTEQSEGVILRFQLGSVRETLEEAC